MYHKILFLLLFSSLLHADSNLSVIDQYHDDLCKVLVNYSNSIDDYFVDENSTTSSKTYAEFSTSMAKESRMDFEKDIRFRIRLNLPKIEKNLRLVFEDDSSDNRLYDGTTLNDQEIESKEYYLRLDYLNYVKKMFNMRLGAGMKIRKRNFVPYLNVRARYELYNEQKKRAEFFNRFRYYSDGEIENNFEYNALYMLRNDLYAMWNNRFYYINTSPYETLASDISLVSVWNDKQNIRYGFGISSSVKAFQHLNTDYYYLSSTFHHIFYKDWVYYEVSPSILQRKINNFQSSYRVLINFGIHFKND